MTIDSMQWALDISFMLHALALNWIFMKRLDRLRPLHAGLIGGGLLLTAMLLMPHEYIFTVKQHSGIVGRLISAAIPALIGLGAVTLPRAWRKPPTGAGPSQGDQGFRDVLRRMHAFGRSYTTRL